MDVFNVGSGRTAKAPEGRSLERRAPATSTRAARTATGQVTDSYASSARAHAVERHVNTLKHGDLDEVRPELVAKFQALMELGGLDTPEASRRAAEGLLEAQE